MVKKRIKTPEENRAIQVEIAKKWKEYPEDFRIAAVIHDGQWYTLDKWKKVAKVKSVDDIHEWIRKNKSKVIKHPNNISFRVNKKEILNWYKKNNLFLDEEIVPKNYPPRIWNNQTETEAFLNTPKEMVSNLLLKTEDNKLIKKIVDILQPYCQIKEDEQQKIYFYSMNADFLKNKLDKLLTKEEMEKIDLRVRRSFGRRELSDFDEDFLVELLEFYFVLSVNLLKSHQNTMKIFLPEIPDRAAQIYEWIIKAIQKFDETAGVPFSGYLASVLNKWPYDLPDNSLGKSMAIYQRKRARVLKKYKGEEEDFNISIPLLKEELGMYSDEQFKELEEWHQQWLKIQSASNLNWEDKNSEKVGKSLTENKSLIDNSLRSKIIRAVLSASVKTKNQVIAARLINDLHRLQDFSKIDYVPDELKEAIKKELSGMINDGK